MVLLAAPVIGGAGIPQTISFDAIPNQILGISPFQIVAHSDFACPSALRRICRRFAKIRARWLRC